MVATTVQTAQKVEAHEYMVTGSCSSRVYTSCGDTRGGAGRGGAGWGGVVGESWRCVLADVVVATSFGVKASQMGRRCEFLARNILVVHTPPTNRCGSCPRRSSCRRTGTLAAAAA